MEREHLSSAFLEVASRYPFLTDFDRLRYADKERLMLLYYLEHKEDNVYREIRDAYEDFVCLHRVNKLIAKTH